MTIPSTYLHQMVVAPTRHQNLLDLVLTNQPDIVAGVQVLIICHLQIMMLFSSLLMLLPRHRHLVKDHYIITRKLIYHFYVKPAALKHALMVIQVRQTLCSIFLYIHICLLQFIEEVTLTALRCVVYLFTTKN